MQGDSESDRATINLSEVALERLTVDRELSFAKLINRYLTVWLWSIVLGAGMSATLTLPRPQEIANFGYASTFLLSMLGAAYLSYFGCFVSLFAYLVRFIIPYVLRASPPHTDRPEEVASFYGFRALPRAFGFLIIGIGFQAVLAITTGALASSIHFR